MRERDFVEILRADGMSPAWPLGYDVFKPYYVQASACSMCMDPSARVRVFESAEAHNRPGQRGLEKIPRLRLLVFPAQRKGWAISTSWTRAFPSIGAINRTLTISANALRVADVINERWSPRSLSDQPRW
jgi:hypothetical protein